MAKKRRSVFDTDLGKEDIKKEAQSIEKKALQSKDQTSKGAGKLMHLYVDQDHHTAAKIRATQRGMKLGEYIEWLIDQDKA